MEWIHTDKINPQDYKPVLILISEGDGWRCEVAFRMAYSDKDSGEKKCYRGWYSNNQDWIEDYGENRIKENVLYWMPLPDEPIA
jgi:hypothetical protein